MAEYRVKQKPNLDDFITEVKLKFKEDLHKNPKHFQDFVSSLYFFGLEDKFLLNISFGFKSFFLDYFPDFPTRIFNERVLIAKNEESLWRGLRAYKDKDSFALGLLYGIPICDVLFFEKNKGNPIFINVPSFAINHPIYPFFHVPCSPHCNSTISRGRKILDEIDNRRLKDYVKEQTKLYHFKTLPDNLHLTKKYVLQQEC